MDLLISFQNWLNLKFPLKTSRYNIQFNIVRRPYSQIKDISETEAKSVFYFSIQVQLTILIKKCSSKPFNFIKICIFLSIRCLYLILLVLIKMRHLHGLFCCLVFRNAYRLSMKSMIKTMKSSEKSVCCWYVIVLPSENPMFLIFCC